MVSVVRWRQRAGWSVWSAKDRDRAGWPVWSGGDREQDDSVWSAGDREQDGQCCPLETESRMVSVVRWRQRVEWSVWSAGDREQDDSVWSAGDREQDGQCGLLKTESRMVSVVRWRQRVGWSVWSAGDRDRERCQEADVVCGSDMTQAHTKTTSQPAQTFRESAGSLKALWVAPHFCLQQKVGQYVLFCCLAAITSAW